MLSPLKTLKTLRPSSSTVLTVSYEGIRHLSGHEDAYAKYCRHDDDQHRRRDAGKVCQSQKPEECQDSGLGGSRLCAEAKCLCRDGSAFDVSPGGDRCGAGCGVEGDIDSREDDE